MFEKAYHAEAPDAQRYDEVRIVTVPRWKESELSGDEWRISARVEMLRKGRVVFSRGFSTVETAAMCLPALFAGWGVDDSGEYDVDAYHDGRKNSCDQEGCREEPKHWLALKSRWDNAGNQRPVRKEGEYRQFCDRHKGRGDCGLDDNDDNYEHIQSFGAA